MDFSYGFNMKFQLQAFELGPQRDGLTYIFGRMPCFWSLLVEIKSLNLYLSAEFHARGGHIVLHFQIRNIDSILLQI